MGKIVLITGITGQDGSYLADLLLEKNYEVHGLVRQTTQFTVDRWGPLTQAMQTGKVYVHHGDLCDASGMRTLIDEIKPDEIYNLAAQSHVGQSFEQPINTVGVTAMGALHLLEAIRRSGLKTKFYQASSSEMFGKVQETPQIETTRFYPRSPYGCAKVFAHDITVNYREAYGMFTCSGILFNHESERRGENFVTRKITRAIGRILTGQQTELVLGNTDTKRDWGYAPDYVNAMWLMMQNGAPSDYVIGTGKTHTVQDFLDLAFEEANLDSSKYVKRNPQLMRPAEVDTLCANPQKAKDELGWVPTVQFKELVARMLYHDIKLAQKESTEK